MPSLGCLGGWIIIMSKNCAFKKLICIIGYYAIIVFFVVIAITASCCCVKMFYPELNIGNYADLLTAIIAIFALIITLSEYLSAKDEQAIVWRNPLEADLYTQDNAKELPENLNELNTLLAKHLDSPELTEREHRLLSMITMISQHPQHFSQQNTKQMVDEKWPFCPLCLRDIDEHDRDSITETLKHILNKEAEEYEKILAGRLDIFLDKEESLPVFPGELNKKEIDAAKVALENLNKVLGAIRRKIEQRRRNIYEAIKDAFSDYEQEAYEKAVNSYKTTLGVLAGSVERFNTAVNKRNETRDQLITDNLRVVKKEYYP